MDDDDISMEEEERIDIVVNAENIIKNIPKIESLGLIPPTVME